ncbi:MAG TPA: BTAD domain-containing putative transcriptional regulator [Qipengyuania sp.]|nr:BTAD domain-containing putative transcriptional regulator [Qipengyuania sp.]
MPQTAAGSAPVTLALFGAFRVASEGEAVALRSRKACALLAFLALAHGHRATREQLADLLWTDRGAEQARASLRQTLAELRALAPLAVAVAIDREAVSLGERSFTSDIAEIMAAAGSGEIAALARALMSIEGDLLESMGDVSERFDEWLTVERPARRAEVVAECLACAEGSGMTAPDEAQAVLRALDRIDPANEAVARLGMRLDHAAGDSAALHRRYRRLADQLQSEFGAAPAEATRMLFQQLTLATAPVHESAAAEAGAETSAPAAVRSVAEPAMTADLIPAVIVAPLQLVGEAGLSQAQAEFCSDDMRVAISAMSGIRVLAVDPSDLAILIAQSADSLALYLLSGKISDPGGGPVATLQLADARSHAILWTASLVLADTIDPLEAIVAKAVGALQPAIDRDLENAMRTAAPERLDERALYTKARLLIRSAVDLADTLAGVEVLERVVACNSRHLGARLLLARMYNTDFWQQMTGHDVAALRARAAEHLEIAAKLAPDRMDVRVRRAWMLLRQGAYDAAARDFDAVLGQRQLDPDILNQCGFGLCHLGDLERAAAIMQRAFDLNPFAPSDYHADYAVILALRGKAEEAEEHFLVSGETGLQYDAVRIANFVASPISPPAAAAVHSRFARKFIAAWQGARSPCIEDVLAWIGDTLPLRQPDHSKFVTTGLAQTLPSIWPSS